MADLTNNAVGKAGNALGPRTRIINLANTNIPQSELDAALKYLAAGDVAGTNDAHQIAGVSVLTESGVFTGGTTDNVQIALQGSGAFTAASNFGTGTTGITSSLLADFDQIPV